MPRRLSAAMATGSIPYQALKKARAADTLALSQPVFDEVFDVLHRPRLARFIDVDLRVELLDQLFLEPCGLNRPSL
jgi:hypothetical protein